MAKKANREARRAKPALLKLDLGCGRSKQPGHVGVDIRKFEGVDVVADLTQPWQWADNSVESVHCSHFIEHLDAEQRVHFVNELYRVLVPAEYGADGKPVKGFATIIAPHWNSVRAYGDLTHKWPPVCEMWFDYLHKPRRDAQAPHNEGYACDFDVTWGYSLHPDLNARNEEYKVHALRNFKEAAQDIIATFIKKVSR